MLKATLALLATLLCWVASPAPSHSAPTFAQLKQDCDQRGRSVSCAKVGVALEKKGKRAAAAKYYKAACHAFIRPIGTACYLWGLLLPNKSQALAAFLRACQHKDADGCTAAGEILAKKHAIARALGLFKRGCALRDGRGCHRAGRWLSRQRKLPQAIPYLKRACALKYPAGCGFLGWFYEVKKKDRQRARRAYQRGCQLKGAVECARLGLLLFKMKQPKRSLRYLRRACRWGFRRSCKLARKLNMQLGGPAHRKTHR